MALILAVKLVSAVIGMRHINAVARDEAHAVVRAAAGGRMGTDARRV
ncbi:hypothetical protein [Burkholderia plantarii]|nr:hypothetical protein [Burkholderia plantarii]